MRSCRHGRDKAVMLLAQVYPRLEVASRTGVSEDFAWFSEPVSSKRYERWAMVFRSDSQHTRERVSQRSTGSGNAARRPG